MRDEQRVVGHPPGCLDDVTPRTTGLEPLSPLAPVRSEMKQRLSPQFVCPFTLRGPRLTTMTSGATETLHGVMTRHRRVSGGMLLAGRDGVAGGTAVGRGRTEPLDMNLDEPSGARRRTDLHQCRGERRERSDSGNEEPEGQTAHANSRLPRVEPDCEEAALYSNLPLREPTPRVL